MNDPLNIQNQIAIAQQNQIAIAQLGKEIQELRDQVRHLQESSQSFKEYSLGNFARFEIKMAILIRASVFLATSTGGVMIIAFMNLILKKN